MKPLRIKIAHHKHRAKIKIRYVAAALMLTLLVVPQPVSCAAACPDVRVVFARGSGGAHNEDPNYLTFRTSIERYLSNTELTYEFIDLDYPAVGVGIDNLGVTLGALFGSGEAYEFGKSVALGSSRLIHMVNSTACPTTKYVLGGYSQGAIVVSKSLPQLNADRLIYAATFGDPKLYLPEGAGLFPDACFNRNLSDYRRYVPDCQTHEGLLGGYKPYEPTTLAGKLGTWCNRHDLFCSPFFSLDQHTAYISDHLYEDAAKVIFDKINQHFGLGSRITSAHDTVILIDSTDSMRSMIDAYKSEALRLANETFAADGRVALYDYRDLAGGYDPIERCNFSTCTPENFAEKLAEITVAGGGDRPESLLSAAYHVMWRLQWKFGATKSLVILTDAGYLSPDRDRTTFADVVSLSRAIDPVNFYVITTPEFAPSYETLAAETDGRVVTNFDELSLLTDYIMDRYDSLPRVEITEPSTLPELSVLSAERLGDTSARLRIATTGDTVLIALNDAVLGMTRETTFTITGLDPALANTLTLVPIKDETRGAAVAVSLNDGLDYAAQAENPDRLTSSNQSTSSVWSEDLSVAEVPVPKAPNTGLPSTWR